MPLFSPPHLQIPWILPLPYTTDVRLLLAGNYGVGNLGDELLREYFLRAFPEVEWTVVADGRWQKADGSASLPSAVVPRFPLGVRSFLTTPWWRTLRAIRRSDGVVFGGGSLFTDTESMFACILWWWHAAWARLFGKPIYLAFQGLGPFRTRVGEWCARWVVARAFFISTRDEDSARRVGQWHLNKKIVHSFDPVFILLSGDSPKYRSQKVFMIIPRRNSGAELLLAAREVLLDSSFDAVIVLSLQSGDPQEQVVCKRIASAVGGSVRSATTGEELREAIGDSSFVLSERYHGALAALAMDVPFRVVPQRSADKLEALTRVRSSKAMALVEHGEQLLRKAFLCYNA
jgi:polysaccharide pyruvyl transferase WcaK-like protein